MSTDIKPKRETVTEPPKRWRNKWHILVEYTELKTGHVYLPGTQFGNMVWPSKDVAEAMADKAMRTAVPQDGLVYLGAFPVDE